MSYDYLILNEKKDAFENFKKALGGSQGMFNGHSYKLVHAQGHLLKLEDPEYQVPEQLRERYKSWDPKYIPWNISDFAWRKRPKNDQARKLLKQIRDASKNAKAIVIATDDDPSGEGELIAWEIIIAIRWNGPVYREYHDDEEADSIRKALSNLKDVSNPEQDGDYLKSSTRTKWDYLSMPLTRLATSYARNGGYYVRNSVRLGRLKSTMVAFVYQRLQEIQNYVKKPYYEVKYQDDQGHLYARKTPKNEDELKKLRHADKASAVKEAYQFTNPGHVSGVKRTTKHQSPKTLLDLSKLDAILSKQGYPSKTIQDVYQQLYQEHYVSYPRTEDKYITSDQFATLVQNAIKVAKVVGVDPQLLQHWEPRPSIVKGKATHGANRFGKRVPRDLDEIRNVVKNANDGDCAVDIYRLVAKSTLAIFGNDYEYEAIEAQIAEHPEFVTHFNVPVNYNYKLIFNLGNLPQQQKPIGQEAKVIIDEGVNPKPSKPTKEWLYKRLSKYGKNGIGTAATQQSTMSELTLPQGKAHMFNDERGILSLTDQGLMAALLSQNTFIANPHITVQLFDGMDQIGKFEKEPDKVLATVNQVIDHDNPIIEKNVDLLAGKFEKRKQQNASFSDNDYQDITFNGEHKRIKKVWGSHRFTPEELNQLANGETISFTYTIKGKPKIVSGKLGNAKFHGKSYFGFIADFNQDK
ncbi:DNA topoisomerase [uncultured Limosilactobacillus sp.]|uniref:DNA topoisomerase n=1 Tax=uncultured Limosilactobacillus sp. TaxID=2837629 RepID=UPI0025F70DC9|nr:DNA topoisomerase [uncultured Limosilactobacillus sp.]